MQQEPWQHLAQLLSSDLSPYGLARVSCSADGAKTRIGLLHALEQGIGTSDRLNVAQRKQVQDTGTKLRSIIKRLESTAVTSRCPIVGIAGMLNAGKSSLLATYLSPAGRQLVPRGLGNTSGTHRFVLWLPTQWRDDPDLLSGLMEYTADLFGTTPTMLSADPSEAAQQYAGQVDSGGDQLTPLIAFDDNLNALQLGLVDCPDIQSGQAFGSTVSGNELADERKQQLESVGKLCSAFLVVCRLGTLHDERLEQVLVTLRSAMPGVSRMLAVNRVKARYAPETVAVEAQRLQDRFGLREVYVAYDFRSALAGDRIPDYPERLKIDSDGEQHPIFFRADAKSRSEVVYLHDLSARLDVGALARESSRSLRLQLKTTATAAVEHLASNNDTNQRRITNAWKAVADACFDFMAERNSDGTLLRLRLQTSPAIVTQIAESLQRTAPAWMRISLKIDRAARQLQSAVSDTASRLKFLGSAAKSVTGMAKRLRGGEGGQVVTPGKMVVAIRKQDDTDALGDADDDVLSAGCEAAMRRFAEEDATQLDDEQLDAWAREIWSNMSLKEKLWKGAQPLAMVTAPFLAVILIPFDAGGTAVLVFASTKELLAAAGLAALLGPVGTGRELMGTVHRETPWRQLSELFHVMCDSLGLPRPAPSQCPQLEYFGTSRHLLTSDSQPLPTKCPALTLWHASAEFESQLRTAVENIRL
ncbi:MAG: hypothetical protein Aurels2KO_49000 [Aureliella sp.]